MKPNRILALAAALLLLSACAKPAPPAAGSPPEPTASPQESITPAPLPPPEVRWEAAESVPEAVRAYAIDSVAEILEDYIVGYGYSFTDAKITALTQMETGTASEFRDIQLWRLEYRLLPQKRLGAAAGKVRVYEDGWLTERGDAGQPYLLLVHEFDPDAWYRVCVAYPDADTEDNRLLLFAYENVYIGTAMEQYNQWRDAGDAELRSAMLELFDIGDSLEIGLVMDGDEVYNTYTETNRHRAEGYFVNMSYFILTPTEPPAASIWQDEPYYITVRSSDGSKQFTYFGGSDLVCHRDGGGMRWYSPRYKFDGDGDYTLAHRMRSEYDHLDFDEGRVIFPHSGTPEQAAEYFAKEAYAAHRLNLAPGSQYEILDYGVVAWGLSKVSEDKRAVLGWIQYAVVPPDFPGENSALWAGNTGLGEGEWEGWLVMGREFVLQKQADGLWHCIGMGTGGFGLPEAEEATEPALPLPEALPYDAFFAVIREPIRRYVDQWPVPELDAAIGAVWSYGDLHYIFYLVDESLYRLYLPDGTVDFITDCPGVQKFAAYKGYIDIDVWSNAEVVWSTMNEDFLAEVEQRGLVWDELSDDLELEHLRLDLRMNDTVQHYYNALTGERREIHDSPGSNGAFAWWDSAPLFQVKRAGRAIRLPTDFFVVASITPEQLQPEGVILEVYGEAVRQQRSETDLWLRILRHRPEAYDAYLASLDGTVETERFASDDTWIYSVETPPGKRHAPIPLWESDPPITASKDDILNWLIEDWGLKK